MTAYPNVIDEFSTLKNLKEGMSISRYGDGEFKLVAGKSIKSQDANTALRDELRSLLVCNKSKELMIGLPRVNINLPKYDYWNRFFSNEIYTQWINPNDLYYSAFISRGDNAPLINTQQYWQQIEELWRDKDITYVCGGKQALKPYLKKMCRSLEIVEAPARNAYDEIDQIYKFSKGANCVIACLGATATVLCSRLVKEGQQAIDLGHLGLYYRTWKENFKRVLNEHDKIHY